MSDMKKKLSDLNSVTEIASSPGNAHANEYMRGMANGLILAKAIMDDKEPNYIMPHPIVNRDHTALQEGVNKATGD